MNWIKTKEGLRDYIAKRLYLTLQHNNPGVPGIHYRYADSRFTMPPCSVTVSEKKKNISPAVEKWLRRCKLQLCSRFQARTGMKIVLLKQK
jgi:hypothetical protein